MGTLYLYTYSLLVVARLAPGDSVVLTTVRLHGSSFAPADPICTSRCPWTMRKTSTTEAPGKAAVPRTGLRQDHYICICSVTNQLFLSLVVLLLLLLVSRRVSRSGTYHTTSVFCPHITNSQFASL